MEKYYDLIVSLVKSHKKYSGYESILDDIVDDVCSHAKTVLETVSDDSIIEGYLNKIISTSIVTVPKRLGLAKPRQTVSVVPESPVYDEQLEELVLENNVVSDNETFEDLTENNNESIQLSEPSDSLMGNPDIDNSELTNVNDFDIPIDKNLVDKMINGVPDVEETVDFSDETNIANESPQSEFISDAGEDNLSLESADEDISYEVSTTQNENLLSDPESNETSVLLDTIYPVDDAVDNSVQDSFEEESLEEIDVQEQDLKIENDNDNKNTDIESSDVDGEQTVDSVIAEFTPPSYKCFNYTPSEIDTVERDSVIDEIKTLDSKNPEQKIYEIFNLKYKENKSVNEIAELLNIDDDVVLSALNEIIYLVKD